MALDHENNKKHKCLIIRLHRHIHWNDLANFNLINVFLNHLTNANQIA